MKSTTKSSGPAHPEGHLIQRGGWLRAAVLGANDGVVSTASLMMGVVASGADRKSILVSGIAGVVAGAMSMAAGEFVSVGSQRDAEDADVEREKRELAGSANAELDELTGIYRSRGLPEELARRVAIALSEHDALQAHLRDELGLAPGQGARPVQAAIVSAASFASLAMLPVVALSIVPEVWWSTSIAATALASLALLGALGGRLGGASPLRASVRVVLAGALGMALSAGVGRLLGVSGI